MLLLQCIRISIHALREEGDPEGKVIMTVDPQFLSTPSARRATAAETPAECPHSYFYPRPPRGGRPPPALYHLEMLLFLSTPSARRATSRHCHLGEIRQISIHALREEGDPVH